MLSHSRWWVTLVLNFSYIRQVSLKSYWATDSNSTTLQQISSILCTITSHFVANKRLDWIPSLSVFTLMTSTIVDFVSGFNKTLFSWTKVGTTIFIYVLSVVSIEILSFCPSNALLFSWSSSGGTKEFWICVEYPLLLFQGIKCSTNMMIYVLWRVDHTIDQSWGQIHSLHC